MKSLAEPALDAWGGPANDLGGACFDSSAFDERIHVGGVRMRFYEVAHSHEIYIW